MRKMEYVFAVSILCIFSSYLAIAQNSQPAKTPPMPMSFFITSAGPGDGGNLGGLKGADAQCQKLATAAGSVNKTWHAYLSTQAAAGQASRQRTRPHRPGSLVQLQGNSRRG